MRSRLKHLLVAVSFACATSAQADPGPAAVVLANLANHDIYLCNVPFAGMTAAPDLRMTYNEDETIRNRRVPVLLSPLPIIGAPATHLLRAGEAVFLEAVTPKEGHTSEVALLSAGGKQHCAVRYTVARQGATLGGVLQPVSKASGVFHAENAAFLFFEGFKTK